MIYGFSFYSYPQALKALEAGLPRTDSRTNFFPLSSSYNGLTNQWILRIGLSQANYKNFE